MKKLKICRRKENAFTVVVTFIDYGAFPYDGTFPDVSYFFRINTEEELLSVLRAEDDLLVNEIEIIYLGTEDVTLKYLTFIEDKGYILLDCYK